jgi:crotonobetainyl-CoA:carnitine CoA-transferase CaiB-like acyl-CoA transferase
MEPRSRSDTVVERWAASGAMALTGRSGGPPLGPPERLVPGLEALAEPFAPLDVLALLGERAAVAGLHRRGRVSCGGGCRLLRAEDGWLAVSLPRPEDVDAVAAWLELAESPPAATAGPAAGPEVWAAVAGAVARRSSAALVERAVLLQLAVSGLADPSPAPGRPPVRVERLGPAPPLVRPGGPVDLSGLLVVDLTSLWAGPLCTALLADRGADVVKVESPRRPDGARRGPPGFFDLLNAAKRSVVVDLTRRDDVDRLAALVRRADVVVEASRPRALEQVGLRAAELVATGPQVWVSITGHGRGGGDGTRIAFGDDAAVAGGLVARDHTGPLFCADAIADPLTGVAAARSCVDALARGGRVLLDVAMAAVAAELAGPPLPVPAGLGAAPPRARAAPAPAPALGRDTAAVLAGPSGRGSGEPGPSGRGSGEPGPSGRGSGEAGPSGRGSGHGHGRDR